MSDEQKLKDIIYNCSWLMKILIQVRSLDLNDWYVAAGAIRNTVWDYLHGFEETKLNDVDVVYFDELNLEGLQEKIFEDKLKEIDNFVGWEVVNQARSHLMQEDREKIRPKVKSSCESIAYWSETPTCIGVRLEKDDSLTICAPHGLSDLMNLIVKPIPEPYRDMNLYRVRMSKKKWNKIWPKLQIELDF